MQDELHADFFCHTRKKANGWRRVQHQHNHLIPLAKCEGSLRPPATYPALLNEKSQGDAQSKN